MKFAAISALAGFAMAQKSKGKFNCDDLQTSLSTANKEFDAETVAYA
jgi:hypothetical protein